MLFARIWILVLWSHLGKTEHKSEGSAPSENVGALLELGRSILGEKGSVNLTCLFGFPLFLQCYFSDNCCNCQFWMAPHWNAAGICKVPRKWESKFWHSQYFSILVILGCQLSFKKWKLHYFAIIIFLSLVQET